MVNAQTETAPVVCFDVAIQTEDDFSIWAQTTNQLAMASTPIRPQPIAAAPDLRVHLPKDKIVSLCSSDEEDEMTSNYKCFKHTIDKIKI